MLSITMQPGLASATTARNASRSQISTKRTLTPEGSNTFISRLTVAPYMAFAATMERWRSVSALRIAVCSAAMPEAHASAASPLSSAHISSSSAAVEGLS